MQSRRKHNHRRSQDFLWGCIFFLKKVDDVLVIVRSTQAETAKLTTPTPPLSKNIVTSYFDFLLRLWGCIYNLHL